MVKQVRSDRRRSAAWLLSATLFASISGQALAQNQAADAAAPSTNAMVNLIQLLVKQGTITKENGEALLQQAEADAARARANPPVAQADAGSLPAPAAGTIRVPYVPETVRAQIRDEIKKDVMQQAAFEGWAAPDQQTPGWVKKIVLSGDIRFRSQSEFYSKTNSNAVVDFQAINASGPFNLNANPLLLPLTNTRQDRTNRMRIRGRLGVVANVSDAVQAGFKLATGSDSSAISTNQTLGGGFGKKEIWVDQAYIKLSPTSWANASFGRFANPFRSTDLLYDTDLNFDGVVGNLEIGKLINGGFDLTLRGGAFPIDYGSGDFPNKAFAKQKYPTKWLYAGQIEGAITFPRDISLRLAIGYHRFENVQGQLSAPCDISAVDFCSTDALRPVSMTKGNTVFQLRDVRSQSTTDTRNPQYFGLSFDYNILDVNATVTFPVSGPIKMSVDGNYLRNLGYSRNDACRFGAGNSAFNNIDANQTNACTGTNATALAGGNEGFMVRTTIGHTKPRKWGEWSATAAYRYLQTDAVLDSFTDSDFHLGGTNNKGYTLAGTIGLFNGVSLTGRWLSANEIVGEPFAVDVLQADLQVEF